MKMRRYPLGNLMIATRGVHEHHYAPNEPKPLDLETPPSHDEIIKIHYMKHHPMYEFQNYDELSIDPYRYWLHARLDYINYETSPIEKATG